MLEFIEQIKQRLHLGAWTEKEVETALEEKLPAGWSALPDDKGGIYYWNELTDSTTWLKPIAPASEGTEPARRAFARSASRKDAIAYVHVHKSDAKPVGQWPPLPDGSAANVDNPKLQPTPAALVAPAKGQLKGLFERISKGAIAANAVLDRVGMLSTPPPPPMTTKERVLEYRKNNDHTFDEDMWQWRQGKWTHLPAAPRKVREEVRLRPVLNATFKIHVKDTSAKLDAAALQAKIEAALVELEVAAAAAAATSASPPAFTIDAEGFVQFVARILMPPGADVAKAEKKLKGATAADLSKWLEVAVDAAPTMAVTTIEEEAEAPTGGDAEFVGAALEPEVDVSDVIIGNGLAGLAVAPPAKPAAAQTFDQMKHFEEPERGPALPPEQQNPPPRTHPVSNFGKIPHSAYCK